MGYLSTVFDRSSRDLSTLRKLLLLEKMTETQSVYPLSQTQQELQHLEKSERAYKFTVSYIIVPTV